MAVCSTFHFLRGELLLLHYGNNASIKIQEMENLMEGMDGTEHEQRGYGAAQGSTRLAGFFPDPFMGNARALRVD
jgi:hypothetical protein